MTLVRSVGRCALSTELGPYEVRFLSRELPPSVLLCLRSHLDTSEPGTNRLRIYAQLHGELFGSDGIGGIGVHETRLYVRCDNHIQSGHGLVAGGAVAEVEHWDPID